MGAWLSEAGGARRPLSGPLREEFRFPRGCTPPSARTFPGAREVMINLGLALSPPARVPPRPTPCSAAPFLLGGPGRARCAPVTVNSGWRPPRCSLSPDPRRSLVAGWALGPPPRAPEPGPPLPPPPATLASRLLQNVSYFPSNSPFLFKHTANCGEEKYHWDEMS